MFGFSTKLGLAPQGRFLTKLTLANLYMQKSELKINGSMDNFETLPVYGIGPCASSKIVRIIFVISVMTSSTKLAKKN